MGICKTTDIILRDRYSKRLCIKKLEEIIDIDYKNFQIWTNIGWCNISEIKEEINFSKLVSVESDYGILKITSDLLNNLNKINLPKHRIDNKWKISYEQSFLLGYFLKYGILDNRFNMTIRDSSPSNRYILKFLKFFDNVEGTKSSLLKLDNNRYIIKNVYDKLIWNKYFSFCYDLKFNKIIPNVILNSDFNTQTCFLLGYLGKFNYDKQNPFGYLTDTLKNCIISITSKQLLTGFYFICKNIGLNISTGSFIKDKTLYYFIKTIDSNNIKNDLKYEMTCLNTNTTRTYNIIPENNLANQICVGIGELSISTKIN